MNTIITILRTLLNDLDGVKYSDEVLMRLIVVSSLVINQEIDFDTEYTINVATVSISPAPDNDFSLFAAYKAAILLLTSELRRLGYQNIKIVDGPSTIDVGNVSKSIKENLDTFVAQYERMKIDYSRTKNLGLFVTTPTTIADLSVSDFEP